MCYVIDFQKAYLNAVFKVYICGDEKRSNNSDNLQFLNLDILNVWNMDLIFMLNKLYVVERFLIERYPIDMYTLSSSNSHDILLQENYVTK